MNFILSIDQSTSATKAILYDELGQPVDVESREHQQHYPQPGWVEHDLEEIWENVLAAVDQLMARHTDKAASIAFLSITNQRETVGVFQRESGRPLGRAMVWQCRRGADLCHRLEDEGCGDLVTERTGLRLDTYFSAPKLRWWMEENPEMAARVREGAARVGTMDTYLIHRMTEGQVFATDHTNASRTLLFDIVQLCWDEELCQLFGVPIDALPDVRESCARFGETDLGGRLPRKVPICGVMGDSQASLFAQRCYEAGAAKVTFGTGSSVLLNIGDQPRISRGGTVTTVAWVMQEKPTYSYEGIINFSAASIAWLKNQLGMLQSSSEAGIIASEIEGNGGVYLIPAFAGLSAPHWKPEARAAIVGLTAHSTRHHVVRAAEESIAYQLHDVLDMMKADAGVPLQCIEADGGPTRDAFLMQFTADILQIELSVAEMPDGSALGAAMAGMVGMGLRSGLGDLSALPRESHSFQPLMEPTKAQQLIQEWNSAVKRVF